MLETKCTQRPPALHPGMMQSGQEPGTYLHKKELPIQGWIHILTRTCKYAFCELCRDVYDTRGLGFSSTERRGATQSTAEEVLLCADHYDRHAYTLATDAKDR